ncbi:MAG: histidine ammonia-lyase [Bacteroidales bacterium]|nr:histidine ammonia-lyase [Bacteroidales bacterium]
MNTFSIDSTLLSFDLINKIISDNTRIELSFAAREKITRCRTYLDEKIKNQTEPIYGITTGFGSLCNRSISIEDLAQLQKNLVISHACGIGDPVSNEIVQLMLLLKIYGLSIGKSGVQIETVQRLVDLYNHKAYPVVRELGSLGASGDLAPLAHLVLPLLGLGEINHNGKTRPSLEIMQELGIPVIELQSKEGLALLNGTQFMSAHGVMVVLKAMRLIKLADITAAISIEGYNGRIDPFREEIQMVRPHPGQIETARNIRAILADSKLIQKPGKAVQDPYSFRCVPQVHGAVKDTLNHVSQVIQREINSVTDNPTLFPDEDLILSGGNFHGEPLAFAMDFLSIALSELGNIAERRVYRLISGQRGLPEFLTPHPGLNSGFMIPQYAAASVVSQNKQLSTPCSVDSITSSNEQEDHVSMGANAATKALRVVKNVERIIAIELMVGSQALEFRGMNETSSFLKTLLSEYRETVPFIEDDALMYKMMDNSFEFTQKREFTIPSI